MTVLFKLSSTFSNQLDFHKVYLGAIQIIPDTQCVAWFFLLTEEKSCVWEQACAWAIKDTFILIYFTFHNLPVIMIKQLLLKMKMSQGEGGSEKGRKSVTYYLNGPFYLFFKIILEWGSSKEIYILFAKWIIREPPSLQLKDASHHKPCALPCHVIW